MHGINQSAITLKDELEKIRNWAFQCKMGFNTDINKQEQESNHPSLTFNGTSDNQPEIRKKKNTWERFWIANWILRNKYKICSMRFVKQQGCYANFK